MGAKAVEILVRQDLAHGGGVDLLLAFCETECERIKAEVVDDSRNAFAIGGNQINGLIAEQRGPRISGLAQPIFEVDHCFHSRKGMKAADDGNALSQLRQSGLRKLVCKLWLAGEHNLQEL